MRALHYFNFLGVLALALLCVVQWRINRDLNLRTNFLEKDRISQNTRIDEQNGQIKGQAADLDAFRENIQRAAAEVKSAESNLLVSRREAAQAGAERDQLKESVAGWSKALAERDEQLKQLGEQAQKLADDRNEAVVKFNELAGKHNETVTNLNQRTKEFNALVERYNALAKTASQANK